MLGIKGEGHNFQVESHTLAHATTVGEEEELPARGRKRGGATAAATTWSAMTTASAPSAAAARPSSSRPAHPCPPATTSARYRSDPLAGALNLRFRI